MSLPTPFPKCAECDTEISQLEKAIQVPTLINKRKGFIWYHVSCYEEEEE